MRKEPYILTLNNAHPLLEQIYIVLKLSGYNVVSTTSDKKVLAMMRDHRPDVLLLDLTLPNSSSWHLFQAVKTDKKFIGVPIIDVSARVPVGGRIVIEDNLASALDMERLIRSIEVLAQKSKIPQPIAACNKQPVPIASAAGYVEPALSVGF